MSKSRKEKNWKKRRKHLSRKIMIRDENTGERIVRIN